MINLKKLVPTYLLTFLLLVSASSVRAQLPGEDDPSPGGPVPAPAAVPLDGGSSLLLASGLTYGLRRLYRRRMA
jgi:hypothetical protein